MAVRVWNFRWTVRGEGRVAQQSTLWVIESPPMRARGKKNAGGGISRPQRSVLGCYCQGQVPGIDPHS
jgi:hypothetical protein